MPKKGIKKGLDKNNSVTFNLVYRSQRDPLSVDGTAPQRVLVPVRNANKEDKINYRIFFDDEYDYLKHLKDVNIVPNKWENVDHLNKYVKKVLLKDKTSIDLPSSVFESNIQEKTEVSSKVAYNSGLQLDLDPDIIAALDDKFDFGNTDNQLEDNFIELANTFHGDKCDENNYDTQLNSIVYKYNKENDGSDNLSSDEYTFKDEETKSYFTEYSISSNVIKRNEQLNLLDHKFEKIYANYIENEIGDLENDEIEGYVEPNSNVILQYAHEFENQQKQNITNITKLMEDKLKIINEEFYNLDENKDNINLENLILEVQEKNIWDCESILSTYTNTYNNPKLISEQKNQDKINLNCKTDIPKISINSEDQKKFIIANFKKLKIGVYKSIKKQLSMDKSTKTLSAGVFNLRLKSETPEERKKRKKYIKSQRKERRNERKANFKIFKEEKKRQEKVLINMRNVPGNSTLLD